MTKAKYISAVLSHVANRTDCVEIRSELNAHIDDRTQYFIDMGYDEKSAEEKAVEKMGDANETGAQFGKLNSEYYFACFSAFIMLFAFIINLFFFFDAANVKELLFYHTISLKDFLNTLSAMNSALIPLSLFGIIESSAFFILCYKHRLEKFALIGGCTHIITGILFPILYMPFTYGAVSFFTDYLGSFFFKPELCFNENGNLAFTYFNFLDSKIGDGASIWIKNETALNIIYYATIIIVILSALLAFIMGVSMIIMYRRMNSNEAIDGGKKHMSRLVNFITAFVIIGGIFTVIEIATPTVKLYCEKYEASKTFEQEANEMTAFTLELLSEPTEENGMALLDKYGLTYAYSPDDSLNPNFLSVAPTDNFSIIISFYNGKLSSLIISLKQYTYTVDEKNFNDIDTSLSVTEAVEKYTFKRIIQFAYFEASSDNNSSNTTIVFCDKHHNYDQYYKKTFHAEYAEQ